MRWLLYIFLLGSSPIFASETSSEKSLGLRLSYTVHLGNIRDYFKNNFAYGLDGRWEVYEDALGKVYLGTGLQYMALKSDDIRESSSLKLLSLNIGLDQVLNKNDWYALLLSLRPELTRWWVNNNLSRDYNSDTGSHWGFIFGLNNKFYVAREFSIYCPLLIHSQQLSLSNIYFDVGIGIEKSF